MAAGNVITVHTNLPGHPTATVPGLPGVEFKPVPNSSTQFDRPYGNATGNIAFSALVNLPVAEDEVVIMDGFLMAREGTPTAWAPAENHGLIDTRIGISASADVAFATNTSGAAGTDEVIARVNFLGMTLIAQEGTQIPFLAPGVTFGSGIDSALLLANGAACYVVDLVTGPGFTTNDDEILVIDGVVVLREGITIPTGQAGGATEAIDLIDNEQFWASADGSHWIVLGDLNGATTTDDVAIKDGAVVLQEGSLVPGSSFTSPIAANGLKGVHMDFAGGWMVRGSNADGQDWVVRDGEVVAQRGAPIIAGSTEIYADADFADCFFIQVANSLGHYVIGGVTDAPSTNNGVLVLDGTHVIVRENDPIDLDGNGFFDDDAHFNTFGNDDAHLSDPGSLHFMATIRNGAGTPIGQGLFRLDLNLTELESCAAGTAGPNLLKINGHAGGGSRTIPLPAAFPFTISMGVPAGVPSAEVILFGHIGTPGAAEVFDLFGLGSMCFAPCLLPPVSAQPVFTAAESLPGFWCPGLFPVAPAPTSLALPTGLPAGLDIGLQAVLAGPTGILITNGLVFTTN